MKFPALTAPIAVTRVAGPVVARVRALPRRVAVTLGISAVLALLFLGASMLPAAPTGAHEEQSVVRLTIGAWPKPEAGLLDPAGHGGSGEAAGSTIAANGAVISDPALIEMTSDGPLPRISEDGRTPMAVYSRPADAKEIRPRIAVIVTGLGISPASTTGAIDAMPAAATLAFSPYGRDLQGLVSLARGKGNEVLLEVPMEPYDFPNTDPGQNTLLTGAPAQSNGTRLRWIMTRFTGYAGLVSIEGGKFLSSAKDMRMLLDASHGRGVYFVDGGVNDQSLARETAKAVGVPFARADIRIDANPSREMMAQALEALEKVAIQRGSAIGITATYPGTGPQIQAWAESLERKGYVLVPLSALLDPAVPHATPSRPDAEPHGETPAPQAQAHSPDAATKVPAAPQPAAPQPAKPRAQPKPPAMSKPPVLRRSSASELSPGAKPDTAVAAEPAATPTPSKPGPHP